VHCFYALLKSWWWCPMAVATASAVRPARMSHESRGSNDFSAQGVGRFGHARRAHVSGFSNHHVKHGSSQTHYILLE
jgi:hypothetical protein